MRLVMQSLARRSAAGWLESLPAFRALQRSSMPRTRKQASSRTLPCPSHP